MASSEKTLTLEQMQAELEHRLKVERQFGEDLTKLVNKALTEVSYPAIVYQMDEILFDLKYQSRKMADMQKAMALRAEAQKSIIPASSLPRSPKD
jgi:citrate lyase gamma subunit